MGKGFYISKLVAVVGVLVALAALATIIALSVVYSQEKGKNSQSDNNGGTTTVTPVTTPTPTPTPSNEPWDRYRLPKSLVPLYYNLTLWPRLTPDPSTQLYIFTGESFVEFECVEETNLILIHSNKLNYTNANNGQMAMLTVVSGANKAPAITSSRLVIETQYLVLHLDGKLTKNAIYRLSTVFTGELANDLGGFYRSEYFEGEIKKVVATTQMQPTDARKAFPCFDEPAMKAYFNIILFHDPTTTALSNGRVLETTEVDREGVRVNKTVFEQTPKMSTYLLAFIVSDFTYIESITNNVQIRIYARQPAIDADEGVYALNKTGPILNFFETYYNSSYPLPKSDQIALPDFNAGAMENWGLITYRETRLLYNPEFSSVSNKEGIATVIAHELAHMWFGNLVTLRWWNDLWLNEGFASYVEYLGANYAEPKWNVTDLIVLNDVHRSFGVDALASSHPLSSKEEDIQKPAQISEQFDTISYSKGASVLRMLSDFLTETVFKQGLRTYLKEFEYSTAVYTDLWKHLQQAVDDTGTPLPDTLNNIMNTWVLQMGFPVVTVNTATGAVSQEHFLLNPNANVTTESEFHYTWIVPMRWKKNGVDQDLLWLSKKQDTLESMKVTGTDWVLVNSNMVGYYRVNYDDANWDRLLKTLSGSHLNIPVINRAQLLDDAFNMARAKIIPTVRALSITTYLDEERDHMPWQAAINNIDFFYLMFDRTEVFGPMQIYLQSKVRSLFNHFMDSTNNFQNVPEDHQEQYTQINAFSFACRTGLPKCQTLATNFFQEWMNTSKNSIKPNLRTAVYCNAIAAGGADEWNFAWEQFKAATIASEADKLRYALSCTKEPWLLNRFLEYTLDPNMIRKQDATSTMVYIAGNVVGQSLAWDFIRAHWSYIFNEYGGGSFSFSNLINGVTKRFSTDFELEQLKRFELDNADVGFGSGSLAISQSIDRTTGNIQWLSENKQSVLEWFQKEISSTPSPPPNPPS